MRREEDKEGGGGWGKILAANIENKSPFKEILFRFHF